MKEKIQRFLIEKGRILAGLGVLICIAGLALSYIKPKQKLETVAINMQTEGEHVQYLEPGMVIAYHCSTKGYPMSGIQVGISKNGTEGRDTMLLCQVFEEESRELLSETLIQISDLDEGQYVYIPFEQYKRCNGMLQIHFQAAQIGEGQSVGLYMNTRQLEDAATYKNGELLSANLKSYYIYRLDYYPLVFDLLTALFVFVGIFFLTTNKRRAAHE